MGELTLTGLDDEVLARLSSRAAAHGRSAEEEASAIVLAEIAVTSEAEPMSKDAWWERAAELRRETGRLGVNMTDLIREGRDGR